MDQGQLLARLLQLQQEIRILDAEQREIALRDGSGTYYHGEITGDGPIALGLGRYQDGSPTSVPAGTPLVTGAGGDTFGTPWVDHSRRTTAQAFTDVPCANEADCLDENFCYTWSDCTECQWCEGNVCVERDPNRPCSGDWTCPCAPNDGQHYECRSGRCTLTCKSNSDCGECQVCGPDGYCSAGCSSDAQCVPGSPQAVADAKTGSWCVDCECRTPCEPPRFCRDDSQCREHEYCGDRLVRAQGDPQDGLALRECLSGCSSDANCDASRGERCVDHRCLKPCARDVECAADEACNSGSCERIGLICVGNADCPDGELCSSDGRCQPGCRSALECAEGESCDDGRCVRHCSTSATCPEGQVCVEGACAQAATGGDVPVDDRFGCGCGESCTQAGQCLPAPCVSDADCEACSYCLDGICAAGCDKKNPCPSGQVCDPKGHCEPACTTDADCTSPKVCLEAGYCGLQCDPIIPCAGHADCPEGNYCTDAGVCESGCGVDAQCPSGETCVDHSCVRLCVSAADCSDGEQCVDGRCQYVPPPCANDLDCPDGICSKGSCTSGCRADSSCAPGERCIGQRCVTPCTDDAQCLALGPDATCRQGECVVITAGPTGAGHTGCEVWEQCDELGRCMPVPCATNTDCLNHGDQCLATGVCGPCASDPECPGSRICDDGRCAFQCVPEIPCRGDADCPDTFYCGSDRICAEGCRAGGCLPGQTCIEGACETACQTDLDCESEADRCINGACRYVGIACSGPVDCAAGETCQDGLCARDLHCVTDQDCLDGETCDQATGYCTTARSTTPTAGTNTPPLGAPSRVGCEECSQVCGNDFLCHAVRCRVNSDCPCGFCSPDGNCIPNCETNADCASGVCVGGQCVECVSDGDCLAARGIAGLRCVNNSCQTPCTAEVPEGDCFAGLKPGDPCETCPNGCPPDAPCEVSEAICGVSTVWNPKLRRAVAVPVRCRRCTKACTSSAQCGPGSVCVDGYCDAGDGRCGSDADCVEKGIADGTSYRCLAHHCVENGVVCITGADCDDGEVCDDGTCRAGNCGADDPCPGGQTCFENSCTWECGGDPITCSGDEPCPPGMTCGFKYVLEEGKTITQRVCMRPGYAGESGPVGCPTGYFCGGGACVRFQAGERECVGDDNCAESMRCVDGLCKTPDPPSPAPKATNTNPADPAVMDPCAARGMVCGPSGFCEQPGCDSEHPCPAGKCCDQETGLCVERSEHPVTRFGAPDLCTFGPVYCEVLDPEGSSLDPRTAFNDPEFPGCEAVDPLTGEQRCWSGKPLSDAQILEALRKACRQQPEGCDCPEQPANECYADEDCGSCQRCGLAKVGEAECCGGQALYVNQCLASGPNTPCKCEKDSDCSACEVCERLDNGGGYCVEKCSELCPGGGTLSNGTECPTCEETYGPCATKREVVITPEHWDSDKARMVPAVKRCECVVNRDNDCCEGYPTLDDLVSGRMSSGCIEKKVITPGGRVIYEQVAQCANFKEGICAKCITDDHCEGNQTCRNGTCIRECGSQDSIRTTTTATGLECACCTEKGECQGLYATWTESESVGYGPWNVLAQTATGTISFKIATREYAPAREEALQRPGVLEVLSMDPTEKSGKCRPCACTESGIDCGSYASCDGCYQWQRKDDQATAEAHAEVLRIRDRLKGIEEAIKRTEPLVGPAEDALQDAEGVVAYWEEQVTQGAPGAGAQLEAARAQLQAAQVRSFSLSGELANLKGERITLEERVWQVAGVDPRWERVKVCDCCIDGFCRPEEDCSYGTCYLCIKKYGGKYSYELRGKAMENEICADEGPTSIRLAGEQGTCMKYRCSDGIAIDERFGSLDQSVFYEYCTGSIRACWDETKEPGYEDRYKQGWKYRFNLTNAGIYVGSPGTDPSTWKRFLAPEVSTAESKCSYQNPNAFIGSNTLPSIGSVVAFHECCNEAKLWAKCPDDSPNCQVEFETLYEPGDVTLHMKRLMQEIDLLNWYLGVLASRLGTAKAADAADKQKLQATIQLRDQKRYELLGMEQNLATLNAQVEVIEARFQAATSERDSASSDYESKASEVRQARLDYEARCVDLNRARADLEAGQLVLSTHQSNLTSAMTTLEQRKLDLGDANEELGTLRQQLAALDPQSQEHFDLAQVILGKEDQAAQLDQTVSGLASTVEQLQQAITSAEEALADLREGVSSAQATANQAGQTWTALRREATTLDGTVNSLNATCNATYASLEAKRTEVANQANQIALLQEQTGTRGDGGDSWSGGSLQTVVEGLDTAIQNRGEDVKALTKEIADIKAAVAQKKAELADLEGAGGPPTQPEGPVPRPSNALTEKEVQAVREAQIQADEQALKDPNWYPDA